MNRHKHLLFTDKIVVMKTLMISFLMAILPVIAMADEVEINGYIDLKPGETTTLQISPSDASYTYYWDFDPELEKAEKNFNIVVNGDKVTITHLNLTNSGILTVTCTVYDENGNYIGYSEAQIIVTPR